jgi:hypothetical protein
MVQFTIFCNDDVTGIPLKKKQKQLTANHLLKLVELLLCSSYSSYSKNFGMRSIITIYIESDARPQCLK